MIYPTPKADFDGVTTGLRLLEKAIDNIALGKDQPEQQAEYLGEAANLLHDAWLAVQTAYGRALSEAAAKQEQSGYRLCVLCKQFKPEKLMVRELAGYGSEEKGKSNTWWRCISCSQTVPETELDLFESEEGS